MEAFRRSPHLFHFRTIDFCQGVHTHTHTHTDRHTQTPIAHAIACSSTHMARGGGKRVRENHVSQFVISGYQYNFSPVSRYKSFYGLQSNVVWEKREEEHGRFLYCYLGVVNRLLIDFNMGWGWVCIVDCCPKSFGGEGGGDFFKTARTLRCKFNFFIVGKKIFLVTVTQVWIEY